MFEIPDSYVISKFYQYAGAPEHSSRWFVGSCPICHEGKSWLKKKRLFYFPNQHYLYCHNCSRSWTPYFWIKEVSGMSFREIRDDIIDFGGDDIYCLEYTNQYNDEKKLELPELPGECCNLKDDMQIKYFSNCFIVKIAKEYCEKRRLFSCINSPKAIYVSLDDRFHRNRLIIPYYNSIGRIVSYISRSLLDSDEKPKYLFKFNVEKPLFNVDKVDSNFDHIFLFEGPIDSMFVKNGVAVSGIHLTNTQEEQLNEFMFMKKIWVFDNFRTEGKEVISKIRDKMKEGEYVFLYDNEFSKYKDLNQFCVEKKQDFIDPALIIKSSYTGNVGLLKLSGH